MNEHGKVMYVTDSAIDGNNYVTPPDEITSEDLVVNYCYRGAWIKVPPQPSFYHTLNNESLTWEDNRTVAELRLVAELEIRHKYAKQIAAIAAPYSREERETWFTQLKEADEWLIDSTVATPMLTAIATARQITVAELVTKIKKNDGLFRQAIGTLLGQQQAELDLLKT